MASSTDQFKVKAKLSIGKTTELNLWTALDVIDGGDDPTVIKYRYSSDYEHIKMLAKRTFGTMMFFHENCFTTFGFSWMSQMSVLSDLINKLIGIYSIPKLVHMYNFWLRDKQGVSDLEIDITRINFPVYFREPLATIQTIIAAEQERANHLEVLPLDEIIQYTKKMRGSISVLSIIAEDLSNRSSAIVEFVHQFIECIYDTLPDEQKPDMSKLLAATRGYTDSISARLEYFIPERKE